MPDSIDSNITGLSYAPEVSLKVLPAAGSPALNGDVVPTWYAMEPNSFPDFGGTFDQVARETINASRQRLKGTIVDLSSKGGLNTDVTMRNLEGMLPGYFYASWHEKASTKYMNVAQLDITSVSATQILAANGLAIFPVNAIVKTHDFGVASNNLTSVVTASAAGALTLPGLTVEANPPVAAKVTQVGYKFTSGDLKLVVSGTTISLQSTTADFTTMGLNVGEMLFIGGDSDASKFGVAPNFTNVGFARIASVTAHIVVLDYTVFTPVADVGAAKLVEVYLGKFLRNENDPTLITRRTYTLERTLGSDGVGTQAEYIVGAIPDSLVFNIDQTSKITADLSFVGMDYITRTGTIGVMAGNRVASLGEDAINTSSNITSAKMYIVDPTTTTPTKLFSYASNIKITIDNKQTANKAIGVLGAFNASAGDFTVSMTATQYFSSVAAIAAIRANKSVGLAVIIAQNNSGMAIDLPWMTIGNGLNKVEKDKPITLDATGDAAKSPTGMTAALTYFDYLPTVAMPS